jgi:hypothetical protein
MNKAILVVAVGGVVAGQSVVLAQTLTDVVLYRTTPAGVSIAEGWNTRGGDTIFNLYLRDAGGFVNTGNAAATSVSIDLSAPGVYTFDYFGDTGAGQTSTTFFGMNLFFNGNATTPLISVLGSQGGPFAATAVVEVPTPTFAPTTGSGTLTAVFGSTTITVTNFTIVSTQSTTDTVQPFAAVAGGSNDTHGVLEITVTPVPGAAGLLVPAALLAGKRRRR